MTKRISRMVHLAFVAGPVAPVAEDLATPVRRFAVRPGSAA